MKRRRLFALAMFAAPLAFAFACTFPDVTFGPVATTDDAGQDSGSTNEDASTDANANSVTDAPVVDVVRREDGGGIVADANICETDARAKCDCDDDEYADEDCDVDASGLVSLQNRPLKLGDCDDLDSFRHPGVTDYVADPLAPGQTGDWDCSNIVEYFPKRGFTCSGNGLLGCVGEPGFASAPACGTEADVFECVPGNLLGPCVAKPAGRATQACK